MSGYEVETVVRIHVSGENARLEVGTDPDVGSCVQIRTPDASSSDYFGKIELTLPPELARALAAGIVKVAESLK